MQFDVITVDVGEMLADLGDAYGKWHLRRAGCIRQTRGQREGLGALGCTRRGRSTHQYRSRSVRPGQLSRRRALESLAGCLERGAASVFTRIVRLSLPRQTCLSNVRCMWPRAQNTGLKRTGYQSESRQRIWRTEKGGAGAPWRLPVAELGPGPGLRPLFNRVS